MRDNSNWTLRFNRTSRDAIGYDLKSSDFKSENEEWFYVAVCIFIGGVLGAVFF